MSSLSRWDPMPEATSLRDAMNQLVEGAVLRPGFGGWGVLGAPGTLGNALGATHGAMNVFETNGRYYCQVLLPGASPEDIDLTVRQNTLTLRGKTSEPLSQEQRKGLTYLLREFGAGEFTRSIAFPKDVQGDVVQARYENGVLVIEIPIAEHAQPRRITIQGSAPSQIGDSLESKIVDGPSPEMRESVGAAAVNGSDASAKGVSSAD